MLGRWTSLFLLTLATSCGADPEDTTDPAEPLAPLPVSFGARQDLGVVEAAALSEASGLVASRQTNGVLWSHNDSGDGARLFALDITGANLGTYTLTGIDAYDWEDIAIGPGPVTGQDYLYVGDIGDNFEQATYVSIVRVPEPTVALGQSPTPRSLPGAEELRFAYPGGARDAEALMVDPKTADLYIVTKDEGEVYVARAPHTPQTTAMLERVGVLSVRSATAADISPAGDEILIKNYDDIFHWQVPAVLTIAEALTLAPTSVPYQTEPQGEALAWSADRMGYLTVSEEPSGVPAHLYFYPRTLTE